MKVVIFGSQGFVGRATSAAFSRMGHDLTHARAPRLGHESLSAPAPSDHPDVIAGLRGWIADADVVVNCAGLATPSASLTPQLIGANMLLPHLLTQAALSQNTARIIHVSSAAVLGSASLHERPATPNPRHSPYAQSKAAGEAALMDYDEKRIVILRPTSVHGPDRPMSHAVARLARSPLSFYATDTPTPQVLVQNVAAAILFLATAEEPPRIALQPNEGLTTRTFLQYMGSGRSPHQFPARPAGALTSALASVPSGRFIALGRRVEMLAFGQRQERTWFDEAGFQPTHRAKAWQELGEHLLATSRA